MNIFHKVALQGLKKNRAQTIVTVIGVILSTALVTAVTTFAISLQSYMIQGAIVHYGNWHVQIPNATVDFMRKQAEDHRVAQVIALQNIGYAELKDGKNPDKPYLFLTGWDENAMDALPIKIVSGRLPQNSSEIVVPAHVAANGGVKLSVGDTFTLSIGNRMGKDQKLNQHDSYRSGEETLVSKTEKSYTVVGICQRLSIEEYTAPGYTVITTKDTNTKKSFTALLTLENPYRLPSYLAELPDDGDYVLNNDVLRFMGLSDEKMVTVLLYSIGGVLIALVMLGSVFLIYNSFHISLNERTHQFGILMSVGATEKQLRNTVLFEGICIGIVGIPLGILVGIPSIQFVISLVAKNFANVLYDNVAFTLVVSVPALVASVLISMITILISAYLPAKKAAGIPVMECIRQTNEIKVEANSMKTSKIAERFYGLEEVLAWKNFKRNGRRYRSIILSLTLSIVLFVSASSFGDYLKQIAEGNSEVVEDYDICFTTQGMEEQELLKLYDKMKAVEGVTESRYQALSTYSCILKTNQLPRHFLDEFGELLGYDGISETVEILLDVQFVEERVYQNLLKDLGLPLENFTGEGENMIMAGILADRWYTQEEDLKFVIAPKTGEQTKQIKASFVKDYPDLLPQEKNEGHGYTLLLMAPYRVKAQFDALDSTVKPTKLGMTFQSEQPSVSTSKMQSIIEGVGITADYRLYNVYGILDQNRNLAFIVNLFSAVFSVMISLIAVANVFNTISTNIKLRRRELAMLRSVGMSDQDFNKMMRFECTLYGVRTMLISIPLSVVLSCLIYKAMISGGGTVQFMFPWGSMLGSIGGVFLVVFISMLYAVNKIKKENIIDALRDDMT